MVNGVNINTEQKQKFLSIRDFNKTSMRQSELLQTKQISYKVMICYLPLILNPHPPKKEQRERERYTNQKKNKLNKPQNKVKQNKLYQIVNQN